MYLIDYYLNYYYDDDDYNIDYYFITKTKLHVLVILQNIQGVGFCDIPKLFCDSEIERKTVKSYSILSKIIILKIWKMII